jgi:hypothetical protein
MCGMIFVLSVNTGYAAAIFSLRVCSLVSYSVVSGSNGQTILENII